MTKLNRHNYGGTHVKRDLSYRMAAIAVSGAVLCATTSCDSGTARAPGAPSSSRPAPSGPAATALNGPAVAEYGQAAVQRVYRAMLAFTFDNGWNPNLILKHVDAVTRADFTNVLAAMTPQCAATFKAAFARVEKHDKAATRTLEGAIFFGIRGPNGITPTQASGLVTNRRYTQVTLGIDKSHGVDRLTLAFTAKADIHMQDAAGQHYVLPTSRVVHFLLVPNRGSGAAGKPFLIGSWKNTMTASRIQPAH